MGAWGHPEPTLGSSLHGMLIHHRDDRSSACMEKRESRWNTGSASSVDVLDVPCRGHPSSRAWLCGGDGGAGRCCAGDAPASEGADPATPGWAALWEDTAHVAVQVALSMEVWAPQGVLHSASCELEPARPPSDPTWRSCGSPTGFDTYSDVSKN